MYAQLAGFAGLNLDDALPQPDDEQPDDRGVLACGNIEFVDNQVVLDARSLLFLAACSSMATAGIRCQA